MVQDKANGTIRDLRISPVKSATLSLSYYTATLFSTLIICFAATGICLTYVAIVGWNMLLADIFFLFLDILLLVFLEQHYLRLLIFSYQHKDKFQR